MGVFSFLRKKRSAQQPDIPQIPEHIVILKKGREYLKNIIDLSLQIEDGEVAVIVTELGVTTRKIYKNLEADPRDLSVVRNFVDYHAPKCVELIREYLRVVGQSASPARDESLASSIKVMKEMHDLFEVFFKKCLENDVDELAVLSETMRRIGVVERPVLAGPTTNPEGEPA